MDYENVGAADFGRSLKGIGLNILTRDVEGLAAFLSDVFGMQAYRVSGDFAIMTYGAQVFQIHGDHTYHSHPLPSLLPETGPRGGGVEFRLYDTDPDAAWARAEAHSHESVGLQAPMNKPHGTRECVILCENGYAWLPSRPLSVEESAAVGKDRGRLSDSA
ncbi:VOC family protein [Minwuia sp.]|uniref:VOC family protein n=1 Tax=Minwuia sp. TaxID=2493630 RepID=UPI003A8DB620